MWKTRKIPEPIKKGVAKVPVVMQLEAVECGAASLTMILAYYGKWIPLEQVRADCGVSRDGTRAGNLLKVARSYGLSAKGYRYDTEMLKKEGSFPCIIHWNFNHFLVLNGFKNNRAYLNDPSGGVYNVPMEQFEESFTGICLMFAPTEEFVPSGMPKSVLGFAKKRLNGAGAAITFALITALITSALGILDSVFSRIFLDRLLTGKNPQWAGPFFLGLILLGAVQLLAAWIQAVYSLKINGKLAVIGNTEFMWKVFRLPMEFFSQRAVGDIQQRQAANASIAQSMVELLAPLALDTVMMVLYLSIMIRYSPLLTLVGLTSVFLHALLTIWLSRRRLNILRVQMRDAGKLAAATVTGIEMIETLKANGAENGFFERWAGYQADANTQQVKSIRLTQYLGMLPGLLSLLTDNAILILGVYLTMQGRFTEGMILAFQGFFAAFCRPCDAWISSGQKIQEMRAQMERVEDVMEYPDQQGGPAEENKQEGPLRKLSGQIELKEVTFGYSRLEKPLLHEFSLSIKKGSRIAIVGASGCGKSTLSRLISGLYSPWSGEILFDGRPLEEIHRSVFKGSLAVVDQEIILFEDTIAANIRMWDDSIEDFEVIMAARDAMLHEDIMQREGGYNCGLQEGGRDLSGGQRQRLEIARVLAQDPTIIILDEATSALDAKTEDQVVKAIQDRGITCIVVAHRLSAIRDCDEIIVLDEGRIAQRGSHEELFGQEGIYRSLVMNG